MAEIPCPACGKPNPDHRLTCQFCEAPLTPEKVSSEPSTPSEESAIHPGEAPTKIDTAELEPILPQWLREARQQARDAVEEEEVAEPGTERGKISQEPPEEKKEEGLPDWLAGLDAQREEEEDELPDWLASVQADIAVTEEGEEPPAEGEEEPAEEEVSPPIMEGMELQDIGTGELPDWLSDLQSEPEEGEDEIFQFPTEAAAEEMAAPPAEELSPPPFEMPSSPSRTEKPSALPEEETPAWLTGAVSEEEPREAPADEGEALPDWLKAEAAEGTPEAVAEETPSSGEELPEWLRLSSEEEAPPAPAAETKETETEEELPDWLAAATEAQAAPTAEAPFSAGESKEEETPPEPVAAAEEAPSAPPTFSEEPSESSAEVPEWLSGLREGGFEQPEKEQTKQAMPSEGTEETPDWLSSLPAVEGGRIEPMESGASPFAASPPQGEPVPAFIMDEEELGEDMDEIFAVEMPDWLSALSAEKEEEESAESEEADELSPAELPDWVRAMRPVEAVVPDSPEETVPETVVAEKGPLAGLTGVLPAQPGIGPLSKPRPHAIKLQVTKGQQVSASLLDEMLESETTARPLIETTRPRSQRLLRWILTLLLLLALGLPILGGTGITPLPSLRMVEIEATNGLINQLPPEASVLVVFDYTPALAGEVETAAVPVIDHLMVRGARMALLSTTPLGPRLAERLLAARQAEHGYLEGQGYINLGYLAGETAGILSFAANPNGTLPVAVDGTPAWDTPPLADIHALSDFDALFVLTGDANIGQAWIEQTRAYRGETPLVLVISAQAEPMIRPYYEAGQVQGIVAGLYGGTYYERLNGRFGAGRRYLDAFSLGTLVAAIAIGLGGAWGLLLSRTSRHDRRPPDEK